MKIFTKLQKIQKIIISITVVMLISFTIPSVSNASGGQWMGSTIGQPIMQLMALVGDAGMGILHRFVLGVNKDDNVISQVISITDSVLLDPNNETAQEGGDLYDDSKNADSSNKFKASDFSNDFLNLNAFGLVGQAVEAVESRNRR